MSVRSLFLLFALLGSPHFTRAEVIEIGSRLELCVDDALFESHPGVRFVLHRPKPHEVAITYDRAWEGNTSGYPTVIRDGETYRLYYRGGRMVYETKLQKQHTEVACYAESKDGIHWKRAKLKLHKWPGGETNNIIWRGPGHHNFAPFLDANPACPPASKFKAVGGTYLTGLHVMHSADGIHWTPFHDQPVLTKGAFDSHNIAFWDPARKKYVLYYRVIEKIGGVSRRAIAVVRSDDMINWSSPEPLAYGDSPPQEMYTNGIGPYFRAPHILFGFPTRYVAHKTNPHGQELEPVKLRKQLAAAYERVGSDLTDGLFMTSRDGTNFRRWDEAFFRPGPQAQGRWVYGDNYQSYGLFQTKNADGSLSDDLSFLMSEQYWRDGKTCARRYSIRMDGFVSAQAPLKGGELVTKPLRFSGNRLVVNYATSAAGSLRVELQSVDGEPLENLRLEDSVEHYGDTIRQTIKWKQGSDVSKWAGRPVRVRFVLRDGDLYSFRFTGGESSRITR